MDAERAVGMSRFAGLFASCLLLPMLSGGVVHAQDDFSPPNKDLDKDLDKALEKEFEKPPKKEYADPPRSKKRGRSWKITFGLMGAFSYTELYDVTVSHREGAIGGQAVRLVDDRNSHDDDDDLENGYEFAKGGAAFNSWINLGKYVAFWGGFTHTKYSDTQTLSSAVGGIPAFTFGETTFNLGDRVKTTLEVMTADFDFVFRPLNNSWITIDLSIGGRYLFWGTEMQREGSLEPEQDQRLEALLPMAGIGLELRPVKVFALFGRFRIGGFEYERDDDWRDDDDDYVWEPYEKEATSFQIDLGIKLIFGESVGFVIGYRHDYMEIIRIVNERSESIEAHAHGFYGGLILQF